MKIQKLEIFVLQKQPKGCKQEILEEIGNFLPFKFRENLK